MFKALNFKDFKSLNKSKIPNILLALSPKSIYQMIQSLYSRLGLKPFSLVEIRSWGGITSSWLTMKVQSEFLKSYSKPSQIIDLKWLLLSSKLVQLDISQFCPCWLNWLSCLFVYQFSIISQNMYTWPPINALSPCEGPILILWFFYSWSSHCTVESYRLAKWKSVSIFIWD